LAGKSRETRQGDWDIDVAAMAGSLVHEIKNPLSTLNINAQLLLEEWKNPSSPREERTVKRLKVMVSEVERLERILQSFLRFTERHELNLRPGSLNDLLEDLAEFIAPEARSRKVQIRLGLDPALGPFSFDADLIRQVFLNLVLNAKHAMDDAGGELIMRTRLVERDGKKWAVGDVIDTGHGISKHVREKIFNLYFSTKKNGSGLGLATSKRITGEHGGFIEVDGEEGKGSQFSVFLPYVPEEVPAAKGVEAHPA
jgi:signal transduction histidine kinase